MPEVCASTGWHVRKTFSLRIRRSHVRIMLGALPDFADFAERSRSWRSAVATPSHALGSHETRSDSSRCDRTVTGQSSLGGTRRLSVPPPLLQVDDRA